MDKTYVIILCIIFVIFIGIQIYLYQKKMKEKDDLIKEIEYFQNQISYIKKNPDMKYQLNDQDIFEIITNFERFKSQSSFQY